MTSRFYKAGGLSWLTYALLLIAAASAGGQEPGDAAPLGQAPWERAAASDSPLPISRINSAVQLLDTYGIDESQRERFLDRQPLSEAEDETLHRVLFRLPQFSLQQLDQWREKQVDWDALLKDPDAGRFKLFPATGIVTRVTKVMLIEEVASRYEYDHYFQVTMHVTDPQGKPVSRQAIVCTRQIPAAWKLDTELSFPAAATGLFLKLGEVEGPMPQFVFAANRVAWLPTQAAADAPAAWVFLAKHGMDVGLFDDVRTRNRKGIGGEDRECFYQLLAAIDRCTPEELQQQAKGEFDLEPLLTRPEDEHGKIMWLDGSARKVTKVLVSDADIQSRFGIDHYYQIDLFISLDDQVIRLGQPGDKDAPEYSVSFPATLCVLNLPAEWAEYESSDAAGEIVNEQIRLPAAFFKLWSYRSQYMSQIDPNQRQPSPMFVGLSPTIVISERALSPYVSVAMVGLFMFAIGGLWFGIWKFSRDSKSPSSAMRRALKSRNPQKSDDAGPDFSGLNK